MYYHFKKLNLYFTSHVILYPLYLIVNLMNSTQHLLRLPDFLDFIELLKIGDIEFTNNVVKNIIQGFNIYQINEISNFCHNIEISNDPNIPNLESIIVNPILLQNNYKKVTLYITVCCNSLIILDEDHLSIFLSNNSDLPVVFLNKNEYIANIHIQNLKIEIDNSYNEEILLLQQKFSIKSDKEISEIWSHVRFCIASYLILKSYLKTHKNRLLNQNYERIMIRKKDFVILRILGISSVFDVSLIYHLERGELMAIKQPHVLDDDELPKLKKRERENIKNLSHPFIPKYYETPEEENFIAMEFINGHTLKYIDKLQLNDEDILIIIFELIMVIDYLHSKDLIYRDLKPNNVMIDLHKNIVLIDFDRLIKDMPNNEHTSNFSCEFAAPEIQNGEVSKKSDIYSLGKIIDYIIHKIRLKDVKLPQIQTLINIINNCVNESPEKRPLINDHNK